jgi:hypothetical protein
VHRNRTLSRRYIRKVYCAHKENTFQVVNQKYVLCTETEHFHQGTSEIHVCNVHRNRTLSPRYIKNVYCAQKQNIFLAVYNKCVLCTETEHFRDDTSEMCTVHRNRTLFRQYIRNVYCVQKHNTLQKVHRKCVLCTQTNHFLDGTSETHKPIFTNHKIFTNIFN